MGRLTTHVLDTALGKPAAGLTVELWRIGAGGREHLATAVTNADGRLDRPALEGAAFRSGTYEFVFQAGGYLRASATAPLPDPLFLDAIAIRFGIAGDGHYHVPLLLSPFGYSTYRGS